MWFRVVVGNAIFVTAIVWQRVATERTLRELERVGAGPDPITESEAPPRP